jgi:FkbM family methyltransferase
MKITKEGWAIVGRDTHMGRWVEEHGRLDFDQSAISCYLPLFRKGDVLLNIGANIGCYAKAFVGKAGQIVCLEPNKEALDCLTHNLGGFPEVVIHPFAASDRDGRCQVRCNHDNIGMAYVEESEHGEVEARTIDGLAMARVDFILMDCEGFELKALQGAALTIRRFQPLMVIEVNDVTLARVGITRGDLLAWLNAEGYTYRNIHPHVGMEEEQLDIICFPRHRATEALRWGRETVWKRFRADWTRVRRRFKHYLRGLVRSA